VGYLSLTEEVRNAYTVLVGKKSEGKRAIRRHGCKWGDNVKMDVKEIG
jgi:hypothetical protein